MKKVKILHEDEDIIVCIKPQGIPAQSDKTKDQDMVGYLKNYLFEKYEMNEEPYVAVVHRLDRPVGGIMVFARNQKAAANLSEQIQSGTVKKYYQAVLTGELPDESGTLTDYLLKDGNTNLSKVVKEGTKEAKKAELNYEVLDIIETDAGLFSYVLIELKTGRHHQIRVQMAARNAGIWGDTKYNPRFRKTKKVYRQIGLYATRLELNHPVTGEHMIFKTDPDGEAFDLLDAQDF